MLVATAGTFDLFHTGHVNLLRRCREMAGEDGEVVVILNMDDFIERYKGRRPVVSYQDRAEVLRACRYVDVVIPNVGGEDLKVTLDELRPARLCVAGWTPANYHQQINASPGWLRARGIKVVYLPYTDSISTTLLRERR